MLLAYLRDMKSLKPLPPVETEKTLLPNGEMITELSGEINIGADGKATAKVSPRLRLLFSGIPVKTVSLHAVLTDGSDFGELAIELTPVIPAGESALDRMAYANRELNDSILDTDEIVFDPNEMEISLKYRLLGLDVRNLTLHGEAAEGALRP